MEEQKITPELINACIASIDTLKKQEDELKKKRFKAEEWLFNALKINKEQKGNQSFENETYKVSFKKNYDIKVDTEKLDKIVADHPEIDKTKLFRFKAEVVAKEYSAATEEIRTALVPCLTTKFNKPTIEITIKES